MLPFLMATAADVVKLSGLLQGYSFSTFLSILTLFSSSVTLATLIPQ